MILSEGWGMMMTMMIVYWTCFITDDIEQCIFYNLRLYSWRQCRWLMSIVERECYHSCTRPRDYPLDRWNVRRGRRETRYTQCGDYKYVVDNSTSSFITQIMTRRHRECFLHNDRTLYVKSWLWSCIATRSEDHVETACWQSRVVQKRWIQCLFRI